MTVEPHPVTLQARERLRDQQRLEAAQLHAVLAAERRLAGERDRAAATMAKAHQVIAARQAAVDDAVVDLVAISGVARAGVLLGREARELVQLSRTRRGARRPQDR